MAEKLTRAQYQREYRDHRRALRELTACVTEFLGRLDAEMLKPSSPERGKRIGQLAGALEITNDQIRHFTLNEPFPLKRFKAAKKEALYADR